MFSSIKRWLVGEKTDARDPIEVYGLPICQADRGRGKTVRVIFADDEERGRDPIYLRKMWDRVWDLDEEADMSELGQQVRNVINWSFPDFQTPLCTLPEGFTSRAKFYAADLVVPQKVLVDGFDWSDLNAGVLRLEYDGVTVKLLGAASAEKIARRRLKMLRDNGARRVNAQVVHANIKLFERGRTGGPCLAVFTFDRSMPGSLLVEIAELLHAWDEWETDDPEWLAIADEVAAGVQRARYHQRLCLPESMTEGFEIFASDLWIHRPYLRDGQLYEDDEDEPDDGRLPCLAEPGKKGGIELLPYDEVDTFTSRRE